MFVKHTPHKGLLCRIYPELPEFMVTRWCQTWRTTLIRQASDIPHDHTEHREEGEGWLHPSVYTRWFKYDFYEGRVCEVGSQSPVLIPICLLNIFAVLLWPTTSFEMNSPSHDLRIGDREQLCLWLCNLLRVTAVIQLVEWCTLGQPQTTSSANVNSNPSISATTQLWTWSFYKGW